MPKAKGSDTLSGMIDSDLDDDNLNNDAFPSPDSNQENAGSRTESSKAPVAVKSLAKTKASSKGTSGPSGSKVTVSKTKPGRKRAPLKDQSNGQHSREPKQADEFATQTEGDTVLDDSTEVKHGAKRKATAMSGYQVTQKAPGRRTAQTRKDGEFEYTPTAVRTSRRATGVPVAKSERTVPEAQMQLEHDQSMNPREDDDDGADQDVPQSTFLRRMNSRDTSQIRQPLNARRRAGSTSDTDRLNGGDVATRRKLGDMTRKFENLDLKYRNLQEIGIKQAEANFEQLRSQSEAKAKAASDLVNALKRELATQKSLNADTSTIQQQISTRDAELSKARALAEDLSKQLAESQNENKTLQAKLANSRSVSTTVESLDSKTPASALRARQQAQSGRMIMVGSAEAAQAAQVAQLKEDLYSDLTGLIMRGVERGTESDIYDCIQTGRNGTLHFKLAIAKDTDDSYEQTEFQYTPRLDSNRDRELIALLPEYLTDEITFSRTNAAIFYGRVVETLTKRRKMEDD